MFNSSLLGVLKENTKVDTDDYPMAETIEEAQGFVHRMEKRNILNDIANDPNASQKDKAQVELIKIYTLALSRFKEGELEELFTNDIENILEDKRQRGLL